MKLKTAEVEVKRTRLTRAALEAAMTEAVRNADVSCKEFVAVLVERIVPEKPGDANWAVKGIKFGKAARAPCSAAIDSFVASGQAEFELIDEAASPDPHRQLSPKP